MDHKAGANQHTSENRLMGSCEVIIQQSTIIEAPGQAQEQMPCICSAWQFSLNKAICFGNFLEVKEVICNLRTEISSIQYNKLKKARPLKRACVFQYILLWKKWNNPTIVPQGPS